MPKLMQLFAETLESLQPVDPLAQPDVEKNAAVVLLLYRRQARLARRDRLDRETLVLEHSAQRCHCFGIDDVRGRNTAVCAGRRVLELPGEFLGLGKLQLQCLTQSDEGTLTEVA